MSTEKLKPINKFLLQAKKLDKIKPTISYYCKLLPCVQLVRFGIKLCRLCFHLSYTERVLLLLTVRMHALKMAMKIKDKTPDEMTVLKV